MSQVDRRAIRGLDRVRGLLGSSAIFTALIGGGRSPADRVKLVPWGQPPPALDPPMPWPGQVPTPLPAVVYAEPLPVEVRCDQGPVRVTVRGEVTGSPQQLRLPDGTWHRIDAWAGPWLVDEQWWEPESRCRVARFQIMTSAAVPATGRGPNVSFQFSEFCRRKIGRCGRRQSRAQIGGRRRDTQEARDQKPRYPAERGFSDRPYAPYHRSGARGSDAIGGCGI